MPIKVKRTACAALTAALAGCGMLHHSDQTIDVPAGLASLHAADRRATLSGDPAALARFWTADAYRAEPGHAGEVGIAAIHADDIDTARRRRPGTGFVDYRATIEGLQVTGGVAVERGFFESSFRREPSGPAIKMKGNLLRVLRRERDGRWRFSQVIWNPAS